MKNLSNEQKEQIFFDALCDAAYAGLINDYDMYLVYNKDKYEHCKQQLNLKNDVVCYEEILLEILKRGGKLGLREYDGEIHSITLQDVYDKMSKVPGRNIQNMLNENGDVDDADAVIQTIFFGEIIFG